MSDFDRVKQVIIDDLARPLDTSAKDAIGRARPGQKWVSWVGRGGQGADAASIRFLKERHVEDQYVVAVEWINGDSAARVGVFSVALGEGGIWRKRGGHSGDRGSAPTRRRPWVNVGAGGNPFYVGGNVLECDQAALVRVVFADGLVLEDAPDEFGIVLFPSGLAPKPGWQLDQARAEIYTGNGQLIARHVLFGRAEPLEGS